MEKVLSYIFGVSRDELRNGFEKGAVSEALREPLQSLLPRITREASAKPLSIYLFSGEDTAETRDLFAYALANALMQHIPTTVLIDCSFLDIGMSGVVPQKDALGFLDLLLYGSSVGVITQETSGGVRVIGAGSFPVTKKMPFVLTAFEEASRRLVAHSRCAIFCGPLHDDSGELHPLIGAVDVPMLVRSVDTPSARVVDPIEEQISSRWDVELLSVRVTPALEPAPPPPTETPLEEAEKPEPPIEVEVAPAGGAGPAEPEPEFEEMSERKTAAPVRAGPRRTAERTKAPREAPAAKVPKPTKRMREEPLGTVEVAEEPMPSYRERRYSSLLPKIVTGALVVVVVVFIIWWAGSHRSAQETLSPQEQAQAGETASSPSEQEGVAGAQGTTADTSTAQRDTLAAAVQPPEEGAGGLPEGASTPPPANAAESTSKRIDSRNILVMDDLENNWAGSYLIHISSFRESAKARNEVSYLESRGFPVFIVFLNLGAKGSWYRVYAGPMDTRDEARNMKKLLDDTPGVRFTRITQVPR